jgi:hypothetical protein
MVGINIFGHAEVAALLDKRSSTGMRFPEWRKAPEEILAMEGHCGLVAAWSVLHYFGKQIPAAEIVSSCRYTKRYGLFSVLLAAGLKELGLEVSFHSEKDDHIGGFEKRGYARARRLGIPVKPAVELSVLLRERRNGRVPIVLYDTASESGHFSPLLGRRGSLLRLPLAPEGTMPTDEFLAAWSAPGILRQCVVVGNSHQGDIL